MNSIKLKIIQDPIEYKIQIGSGIIKEALSHINDIPNYNRALIIHDSIINTNSNENYIVKLKKEIIEYVQQILNGEGRGKIFKKYSNNYLEIEELLFLRITENKNNFYNDIEKNIYF